MGAIVIQIIAMLELLGLVTQTIHCIVTELCCEGP